VLTPNEESTVTAYDTMAQRWSCGHDTPGFWEHEMKTFRQYLPSGKILEIGSGGGRDAKELIRIGYDYVGTDISEKLLAIARSQNPGYQFYQQSVYDLNTQNLFDGFWAAAVLLHIPKNRIGEALTAIARCMITGAVGFISLKEGNGEMTIQEEFDGASLSRFFWYWQQDEFTTTLTRHGFGILETGKKMTAEATWLAYIVQKIATPSH